MTQLSLIQGGGESTPRARYSDPATSLRAAQNIAAKGNGVPALVLECFAAWGPMTDDTRVQMMPGHLYPPTIKSARSRLTKAGLLFDTGTTRKSRRNADMVVWAPQTMAATEEQAVAAMEARGIDVKGDA